MLVELISEISLAFLCHMRFTVAIDSNSLTDRILATVYNPRGHS